ncbi:Beige/BEACH domain containing protein, putative [Angomonas deanei]|uniref:Beige/BEACH domain containing protein, putative n=1 Tax=Angomonas deanei TaxID=59799 RepID=A0A7G2CNB6_9TRYP|nr:Beige/BEACH domain containing protein, putative [Angomonas deanei]
MKEIDITETDLQFSCASVQEGFSEDKPTPLQKVAGEGKWHFRCSSPSFHQVLESVLLHKSADKLMMRREMAIRSRLGDSFSFPVRRLFPLREQRGVLYFTGRYLVFEPLARMRNSDIVRVKIDSVDHVLPRDLIAEETGLDFYSVSELMFSVRFFSASERANGIRIMGKKYNIQPLSIDFRRAFNLWQSGKMSNFAYLTLLNKLAGRNPLDLAQFPVMPWILSDYESESIDLSLPSVYRDLGKPVGCLNPQKIKHLEEKSHFLTEMEEERYLYSTHYSSAGAVAYFTVRAHPEYMLTLQNGRLDHPQRIFESLGAAWNSVLNHDGDVKELIPAFYTKEFLPLFSNDLSFSLGVKDNGERVAQSLRLPKWAKTPEQFVEIHQSALESDFVSDHLHLWIDLVFGFKQDGTEAVLSKNTFHPYCYMQNIANEPNADKAKTMRQHAHEFGVTPNKLFYTAHPRRQDESGDLPILTAQAKRVANCELPTEDMVKVVESLHSAETHIEWSTKETSLEVVNSFPYSSTSPTFLVPYDLNGTVLLLMGHEDRRGFSLYNGSTGEKTRVFPDFPSTIDAVELVSDCALLFSNTSAYLFSFTQERIVNQFPYIFEANTVWTVCDPLNHRLLVVNEEDTMMIFDVTGGVTEHGLQSPSLASQFPSKPRGATCGSDGTFYALVDSGELLNCDDASPTVLFRVDAEVADDAEGLLVLPDTVTVATPTAINCYSRKGELLHALRLRALSHVCFSGNVGVAVVSVEQDKFFVVKFTEVATVIVELSDPPVGFVCTNHRCIVDVSTRGICTIRRIL